MNISFPEVSRKSGSEVFVPDKIFHSLLQETHLTIEQAVNITKEVTKFIISSNLKFLSGPLIRELVCVQLLHHGLEKARLEYTRIGFPYADLKDILQESYLYTQKIVQHVTSEFEAVKKLIEERD